MITESKESNWVVSSITHGDIIRIHVICPYCNSKTYEIDRCFKCNAKIPDYYLAMREFLKQLMKL